MTEPGTQRGKINDPTTSLVVDDTGPDSLTFVFKGNLDTDTTAGYWKRTLSALEKKRPSQLTIDAAGVDYCDGAGIGLLFEIRRGMGKIGGVAEILGLKGEFQTLLDRYDPETFDRRKTEKKIKTHFTEEVGRGAYRLWLDMGEMFSFVKELSASMLGAVRNPAGLRWKDAFMAAEYAGVNAAPIVILISYLVGLIMAFQAVIPLKMFGASIFVADLISLAMVRELGPLMTAIVLAGRSGSAFAAELGTMKVNEEIDALTTMGLEPIRFLVLPRVLAAVVMTPLLTVLSDLVGIIGGAVVLLSLGFPLVTYVNEVLAAITYVDFVGGLVKSLVFGLLIASVGCLRGLQATTGASAVGQATTSAVVSSIILLVVVDGIFSVLFYYFKI